MNTLSLPQAAHEGDVFEFAKAAYQNDIPGFQDPRLGNMPRTHHLGHINAVLDEIEEASASVYGDQVPFTYYPPLWNEPGHYSPHVDGTFRGMAIHKNAYDGGEVYLAHPSEPIDNRDEGKPYLLKGESYDRYRGIGMQGLMDIIRDRKVYKGQLTKNGLTVFSEGNMPGLDPTIHYFQRDVPSRYLRLTSHVTDKDKSPEELKTAARNFRFELAKSDLNDMTSVWSRTLGRAETDHYVDEGDLKNHPGLYIKGSLIGKLMHNIDMQPMNFVERIHARRELAKDLKRMRENYNKIQKKRQ